MTGRPIITDTQNTWCPGCGNFSIQFTLKNILTELEQEGRSLDDVVLVSGIGCHAKIADYLNINSFYSLHGRTIPAATGIKLANPRLTVICCPVTAIPMPRASTTSSSRQNATSTSRSSSTTTVSTGSRRASIPPRPRWGSRGSPRLQAPSSTRSTRLN